MAADARGRLATSRVLPRNKARDYRRLEWLRHGRTLWRHKVFLASFVAAALLLTAAYDSRVPPTFEAESLVMLREPEAGAHASKPLSAVGAEDRLQRELRVFRSTDMAERMVDQLSLHLWPGFNPKLDPAPVAFLESLDPVTLAPAWLIDFLPHGLVDALAANRPALSDQEHAAALRAEVVERTRTRIIAEPADHPAMITVRFASSDPQLAALGANWLAGSYVAAKVDAERTDSLNARVFLEEEISRLRARIAEANIQDLRSQVGQGGPATRRAGTLHQAVGADRELLDTYVSRIREIALREAGQVPVATIIAEAAAPEQTSDPRRKAMLGVVFLGAIFAGSFATFGLDRLDNTFRNAEDLVGLRTLATIPAVPRGSGRQKAPERHGLEHPNSAFGVAVAGLRTTILRTGEARRRKTILLTSTLRNEGKTLLGLSLARIHARTGGRPLLIDCTLRRPGGRDPGRDTDTPGLGDILLGHQSLDEVAHRDERSGAYLVAAGAAVPDTRAALASDAMRRLLSDAADGYDLIILDGPSVLEAPDDARSLGQLADRTLVLVQWGATDRHGVVGATRQLLEAGADIAGAVLTRAKGRSGASRN